MGGGVAFLDYDNDGRQDLLFVNSPDWPWKTAPGKPQPTMALYHNEGRRPFPRTSPPASGLDVSFYGMGVAVGDYDNDGLDGCVRHGGRPQSPVPQQRRWHLHGGHGRGRRRREPPTNGAPAAPPGSTTTTTACSICSSAITSAGRRKSISRSDFQLVGVGRAYGPPRTFEGAFPYLYHNDGNGHFTDVSAAAGVQMKNPATGVPVAKSLGVAPVDIDGDGWIDLIVANDTVQNFVFHNERNGQFKEIGALAGLAFDPTAKRAARWESMPVDFRNDRHALAWRSATSPTK